MKKRLKKALWPLGNQAYECEQDAEKAAKLVVKKARYHQIVNKVISEKSVYANLGRPKKKAAPSGSKYFVAVEIEKKEEVIKATLEQRSCYVVGTNAEVEKLNDREVIAAYKRQNASIENRGFRFLKDPIFFASSLFLKKPSRIMGLLTIMALALLVYSIAQRRLRKALKAQNQTIPNQIKKQTQTPTMRWIFQLLEGIDVLKILHNGVLQTIVHGLTDLKKQIIYLMGGKNTGYLWCHVKS